MRVRRAQFLRTYYEGGKPKFLAGRDYPINPLVRSQILAGAAQLIFVRMGTFGLLAHLLHSAWANWTLSVERTETTKAELHGR